MLPSIFPSCRIGDFQIIALSDGTLAATLDLLSGIETAEAETIQHNAGIADYGHIHINCYLIHGGGKTLLVDAGAGGHNKVGGQLVAKLARLGLKPDDIDGILLTHGHPDHIGGLLDQEGEALFKHAELSLHPLEAEYWQDNEKQRLASERGKRNFAMVRRVLDAYAGKIRLFDENEIVKGVSPVWLPGHTPGHTGFRIVADNQCLLIWGDIVHFPHIQSAHPAVSISFDVNPSQAEETRKKMLQQAVDEKLIIAGMHLDQTGFTCIHKSNGEFRLTGVPPHP